MSDNKHALSYGNGNWNCSRCRRCGTRAWIEAQPCFESAPLGTRQPIVCGATPEPPRLAREVCLECGESHGNGTLCVTEPYARGLND